MKKRFLYLSLSAILWMTTAASISAQEVAFFSDLNDVPVMSALTELPNEGFVFDKPEGRVIESVAIGKPSTSNQEIISYYAKTLPQFGWAQTAENTFIREKERLELDIKQDENTLQVHFVLSPL